MFDKFRAILSKEDFVPLTNIPLKIILSIPRKHAGGDFVRETLYSRFIEMLGPGNKHSLDIRRSLFAERSGGLIGKDVTSRERIVMRKGRVQRRCRH